MKRDFKYWQENIGRYTGLFVLSGFFFWQLLKYPGLKSHINFVSWFLVSVLFLLFSVSYIKRRKAVELANRSIEFWLPFICAPLPMAIIILSRLGVEHEYVKFFLQYCEWIRPIFNEPPIVQYFKELICYFKWDIPLKDLDVTQLRELNVMLKKLIACYQYFGLVVMAFGELITVAGMFWLGSSFSIFTEVRDFIRGGPYLVIRHPLYAGEILSLWGFCIYYPTWFALSGTVAFTFLQVLRAKMEEKKIKKHFSEYYDYMKKTGFLFPKLSFLFEKRKRFQAKEFPKKYWLTCLLCMPFGIFGLHRLYTGHVGIGVFQLFTIGGLGIWTVIDFILILSGKFKDSDNIPLK